MSTERQNLDGPSQIKQASYSFAKIHLPQDFDYEICIDDAADDPISIHLRAGIAPSSPLLDLILKLTKPGGRFLDLGGHIGSVSLSVAAKGCSVTSVEASPQNAAQLCAGAERNHFNHMRVVHAGVSDRPGTLSFFAYGPYGHVATPGMKAPTVQVRAVRVDDLLKEIGWSGVDLIKIDIEGSEIAALMGMPELLTRKDAPAIVCEGNGHTLRLFNRKVRELKETLENFGYRNFLIEPFKLVPVRADDVQEVVVADYLAVKEEFVPPPGWVVAKRLTRAEAVQRILEVGASTDPTGSAHHQRLHLAHALKDAPRWILAELRVQELLGRMRNGDNAELREATLWSAAFGQSWIQRIRRWMRPAA